MGKAAAGRATSVKSRPVPPGYWRWHVCKKNRQATRETPTMKGRGFQLELREEQARSFGVADRLVVLMTPGNAGRGKEPDFWRVPGRDQQPGDWLCLSTPLKVGRSRKELYSSSKMVMLSASRPKRNRTIVCWRVKLVGKPDAGNPHVRFDERESGNGVWYAAIEAPRGKP